ncbi:hypothetical protein NM208_g8757 [Fusarium decemcellulare]|uniref:Uncharacterized protein n=1 Tax=Fusarium decemcellulare TaxID=57161 RepID=A0ACC1S458_9HYPO|nr:hypothetical protein NM208_g8757 [Fusarium decemcellulare]
MESSPIEMLLASWKTSELGTVVQNQGNQEIWPLERVRHHFVTQNSDPKIVCPGLNPPRLSTFSLKLNQQSRNGQELKRLADHDPFFLCRLVLGQKSAWLLNIPCKFTTYIDLKQGNVLVLNSTDGNQATNRSSNSAGGRTSKPCAMALSAGDKLILPLDSNFSLIFMEDSLLATGYIVPPSQQPERITNRLCNVCHDIPFDRLDFEEGLGYPHQPTIQDLLASSESCGLCNLIFQSILQIEDDHEKTNYPVKRDLILRMKEEPTAVVQTVDDSGKGRFATRQQLIRVKDVYVGFVALRSPMAHSFVETNQEPLQDLGTSPLPPITSQHEPLRPWLYGNYWTLAGVADCPPQLIGLGVRLSRHPELEMTHETDSIARFLFRGSEIRLLAQADTPLYSTIPGRLLFERRRDEVPAIKLIKGFLAGCSRNHECVLPEADLPTRVLDLDELIMHQHPLRTTLGTILQHQRGIPASSLPRTFQQAVRLCLEFGIRYLWIDSLCIIQDDPADWEAEADKMDRVYANAWLTVAASSSKGADSGFLTSEQPSQTYISAESRSTGMYELRHPNVRIPFPVEGSLKTPVYASLEWMPPSFRRYPSIYDVGNFGVYVDPVGDEPLNQRGWTLQERFLSPRVVHFASDQVYFQCFRDICAEDGARFQNLMSKWGVLGYHKNSRKLDRSQNLTMNQEELMRCSGGWNFLVESYSRRQLSFETDKLPAIAGMARWLQQETGETYLAGLWKEHTCQDLLWRRYPYEEESPMWTNKSNRRQFGPQKPLPPFKEPKAYRAPSWSWASLDGSVKFEVLSTTTCASFYDASLEYSGNSPFGQLRSGWLEINAPLAELQPSNTRSEVAPKTAVEILLNGRAYQGHAFFDFEPDFPCLAAFVSK